MNALSQGEISVTLPEAKTLLEQGLTAKPGGYAPFILDGEQLYLARYYHYNSLLQQRLDELSKQPAPVFNQSAMKTALDDLFPDDPQLKQRSAINWQKVAAALALLKRLCVISGGPGTGKTTTVLRLLAALYTAQGTNTSKGNLQIKLAAPTGKAAARMQESIRAGLEQLNCKEDIKEKLKTLQASTLHRLLCYKPKSVDFRHNAGNPLLLDVLVVDESSMIDSTLMAKLLDAVPDDARVIMLGDKDQLSPVESGSPFADICQQYGFSAAFARQLEALSSESLEGEILDKAEQNHQPLADNPLSNNLVFLKHSYRFGSDSGIGNLARAINEGENDRAMKLMTGDQFKDIIWKDYQPGKYRGYNAKKPCI